MRIHALDSGQASILAWGTPRAWVDRSSDGLVSWNVPLATENQRIRGAV